jgi:hypothetical protein
MALWNFETLHVIVLIGKRRYKFVAVLELALCCVTSNLYVAIGTSAVCIFYKSILIPIPGPFHVIVLFHVLVLVCVLVRVLCLCPYPVRDKVNMALWIFLSDMAIILSIPKGRKRWCGNLKGLSHERVWVKSVENLSDSPFKRDLLIDTTFSKVHLAGQSLKLGKFTPKNIMVGNFLSIFHCAKCTVIHRVCSHSMQCTFSDLLPEPRWSEKGGVAYRGCGSPCC